MSKSKAKYTPWFPGSVAPVHKGLYEKQLGLSIMFSNWNGRYWGLVCLTAAGAKNRAQHKSMYQNTYRWRGLVKKP